MVIAQAANTQLLLLLRNWGFFETQGTVSLVLFVGGLCFVFKCFPALQPHFLSDIPVSKSNYADPQGQIQDIQKQFFYSMFGFY